MKIWPALLVFVLVVTSSLPAFGQVQDIPPGEDVIVPVRKGQPAPSDGQLFDQATALRWANWLQQFKVRLKLDVEKEQQVCAVETTYRNRLLVIEQERARAVQDDLNERLLRAEEARLKAEEAARNPAFYKTTEFGIVIGVVGTAAAIGLGAWAAGAGN